MIYFIFNQYLRNDDDDDEDADDVDDNSNHLILCCLFGFIFFINFGFPIKWKKKKEKKISTRKGPERTTKQEMARNEIICG